MQRCNIFFDSVGYFFPRCFLAIFFPLEISLQDIFSEITHTNPLPSHAPPQKSNGRPHSKLRKFVNLAISFIVMTMRWDLQIFIQLRDL